MSFLFLLSLVAIASAQDICLCLCNWVPLHTAAVPSDQTCDLAFCDAQYPECLAANVKIAQPGSVGAWEGTYAVSTSDPALMCNQTLCCCLTDNIVFTNLGTAANITKYNITSNVKGKDCPGDTVTFEVETADQITTVLVFQAPLFLVHLSDTIMWYDTGLGTCPGTVGTVLKKGLSAGAIVGIVFGCIVAVVGVIAVYLYAKNRGYEKIH